MNDGHDGPERRAPFTVVLVDDEPLIRRALVPALQRAGGQVLAEASSGRAGLKIALELQPDVVLTDIRLPDISGPEMIERLARQAPATSVLVLTRLDRNRIVEAILVGASGYILKSSTPGQVADAVRATAAGRAMLSPEVAGALLARIRELDLRVGDVPGASEIHAALTTRELDIFKLLASGNSNARIAAQLHLSTHTVSNHIKSILGKLDLENRIQAAVQAVRAGMS